MPRTLYIHAGTAKTGTTALQRFLSRNASLLHDYGILYPDTGRVLNAHHLLAYGRGIDLLPEAEEREIVATDAERWAQLRREAERFDGDVLISSESFPVYFSDKDDAGLSVGLEKIRDLFADYTIKIIVYLRRQDQLLESAYNQLLKSARTRCVNIDEYIEETQPYPRYCYDKLLDTWAQSVGRENIHVRIYEKGQMVAGDIHDDFLAAMGIEQRDTFLRPQRNINPRVSRAALEFFALSNTLGDYSHSSERKPFNRAIRAILGDSVDGAHFRRHGLLTPQRAALLLARFDESNARIARDYLGRADGRLFHEQPREVNGAGEEEPGLELRDAVEVAVLLWEEMVQPLEKENASLKAQLQQLKRQH